MASATTASGTFSSGGACVTIGMTVRKAGPIVRVLLASCASTVTLTVPGTDRTESGTKTTSSVSLMFDGSTVNVPPGPEYTTSVVSVPWRPVPAMVTNSSVENC